MSPDDPQFCSDMSPDDPQYSSDMSPDDPQYSDMLDPRPSSSARVRRLVLPVARREHAVLGRAAHINSSWIHWFRVSWVLDALFLLLNEQKDHPQNLTHDSSSLQTRAGFRGEEVEAPPAQVYYTTLYQPVCVTLEHKTSHEGHLFQIEMYASSEN